MIKVSFIVPVYNVEKYLDECILSIINQTYKNIEIILIDDGSIDNSGKICDKYSKIDKRIIVKHVKNKGVSAARNLGISMSTGEYICFVDSDDIIDKKYLELLLNKRKNNTLVVCRFSKFKNNINENINNKVEEVIFNKGQLILLKREELLHTPCCKLYDKKIINKYNIKFDENISLGEDLLFNVEYLKYIDESIILGEYLYYYRVGNSNSLTNKKTNNLVNSNIYLLDKLNETFESFTDRKLLNKYLFIYLKTFNKEFKNKNISYFKKLRNAKKILSNEEIQKRIKLYKDGNSKLDVFLFRHKLILLYRLKYKIQYVIKRKK